MGQSGGITPVQDRAARVFAHLRDPNGRAWRLVILASNLPGYLRYYIRLKASRYGAIIPRGDPFFERKFVTPYLASFLSAHDRLRIQTHLCRVIDETFDPGRFTGRLREGVVLWTLEADTRRLAIVLRLPRRTMLEGDLTVEVQLDGTMLHRMSFGFVPGVVLGRPEANLLFIGGSQGVWGTREQARQAAKLAGEISPANLLVIALRALGLGLGLTHLVGVSAACQAVVGQAGAGQAAASLGAYDDLWRSNHGEDRGGYFLMPAEAPMDAGIEGANRSRTRRKRRLRQSLLEAMADTVSGLVRTPLPVAAE